MEIVKWKIDNSITVLAPLCAEAIRFAYFGEVWGGVGEWSRGMVLGEWLGPEAKDGNR